MRTMRDLRAMKPAVLRAFVAAALLTVMAACAPATAPVERTAAVEQLSRAVGYYPDQAGARWEYLPDNAPVDDPRVVQIVEGPRVVNGRTLISHLTRGGGAEERKYRSIDAQGVNLYMRTVPGAQTSFDPPIMEFPPAGQVVRGASWGGTTVASTHFPAAKPEFRNETQQIRYRYTVVDRRNVRVPAGSFDVYVINLVTDQLDQAGNVTNSLTQELWYSPYAGEVRSVGGYFLVGLNFEPVYP